MSTATCSKTLSSICTTTPSKSVWADSFRSADPSRVYLFRRTIMPTRIAAAAFVHPHTRQVFTGDSHLDGIRTAFANEFPDDGGGDWIEMADASFGPATIEQCQGFVTTDGEFVSREAALVIAKQANQCD